MKTRRLALLDCLSHHCEIIATGSGSGRIMNRAEPDQGLNRLRGDAVAKGCPFLFSGDVPDQPLGDPKGLWPKMQEVADILDVRIHDLSHTLASLLVSRGASLEMIGASSATP